MKNKFKLGFLTTFSAFMLFIGCKNANTEQTTPEMTQQGNQSDAICDTISNISVITGAADTASVPKVQSNALPRMLELGSVGCKPCEMMSPILDELRKEYPGKLSVEFYDVRKNPAPAQKYKIRLIPTQVFLDAEGKEYFRHEGFFPKEEIEKVLGQMGVNK